VGFTADLDVLKKTVISPICQDSKPKLSSPYPSHYTDDNVALHTQRRLILAFRRGSTAMLRSVDWQLFADVSEQPIDPIFKGQSSPSHYLITRIHALVMSVISNASISISAFLIVQAYHP
jgi:hypothetical protein